MDKQRRIRQRPRQLHLLEKRIDPAIWSTLPEACRREVTRLLAALLVAGVAEAHRAPADEVVDD